ncbi:MAG: prepilin-type N-terminal cleavage/methylation domain-containing protein [Chitinivibrionales bacterium]|nr:prepilin-type N-terminal cleavage/methylation domain-containing protein [Chitinivibrionales bacterium]
MKSSFSSDRSGFTLLELLITIAMISIIFIFLSRSATFQFKNSSSIAVTAKADNAARTAADLIQREVRMAGYNPRRINNINALNFEPDAGNGAKINPQTFFIRQDVNGDGTIAGVDEEIRYTYRSEGGNFILTRTTNNQTETLIDNAASCEFQFYENPTIRVLLWNKVNTIRYIKLIIGTRDRTGIAGRPLHMVTTNLIPRN